MAWLDRPISPGVTGRFFTPRKEDTEIREVLYPYHDVRFFSRFLLDNRIQPSLIRQVLWDNGLKSGDVRKGTPIRLPIERPTDSFSKNPYV